MKITNRRRWLGEFGSLVILLVGIFSFRWSVAEPYYVPTGSMIPTIEPGDRLLVLKSAYDVKIPFTNIALAHPQKPKRGDVIVFRYPKDTSIDFVKRLIGLPGDVIEVSDGRLRVNGEEVPVTQEERAHLGIVDYQENLSGVRYTVQRLPHDPSREVLRFIVPVDHYFFMGDNRDDSNDSRFWGFVPRSYLKGKAMFVMMSLDTAQGWLPHLRWERTGKTL